MPKANSGAGVGDGRPVEDRIRAALRGDGLLVPQTIEELKQFEEELAQHPVEIPDHLKNPDWLFQTTERMLAGDTGTPAASAENLAIAARDGTDIPPAIAARMREDRAGRAAGTVDAGSRLSDSREAAVRFGEMNRLREVADLAEWIARERFPKGATDPAALAAAESLGVTFNDYEDAFDGLLQHAAGRFHIFCNLRRVEGPTSDRARFTLAHELGHYFIDAHRLRLERGQSLPLSQCDYESAQPIEREADCFASHLLMPAPRFVKQSRGLPPGLAGILALRRHFGTSVTSTACRYAELGVTPCVVVKWSPGGVGWRFMSAAAWEAGLGKTIDTLTDLPAGSATARAVAGEAVPAKGFFECGTTAAGWFKAVTPGSTRNAVLVEQAIPLGRFGALTILYSAMDGFKTLA